MKKYNETSINNEILQIITEKHGYAWQLDFSELAVKMLFEGTAKFLGEMKDKETPVAAVLMDPAGNFKFAGIVSFIPNEEDETKGSWNLAFTFNEEDVTSDMKKYGYNDPVLHSILADTGLTRYDLSFNSYEGQEFILPVMCAVADSIKEYMRASVNTDPKMELDGFFTAEAQLDGDKIYVAITPSEILKQHVKDDAAIEAAA